MEITELKSVESFYQEFEENHEPCEDVKEAAFCAICGTNEAKVRVTHKTHAENVCLECMSAPDYQEIIKRENPKRILI